jgi:hypothetical protein
LPEIRQGILILKKYFEGCRTLQGLRKNSKQPTKCSLRDLPQANSGLISGNPVQVKP